MSQQTRAIIVALLGPAVSALGVLWVVVNVLIDTGRELTFRYVILDPGHLVIAVGILVSIICIPVAFQVAVAAPEDVELELFELDPAKQPAQRQPEVAEPSWEEAAEWE